MTCSSGKVAYHSRKEALKALNSQLQSMKKWGNQSVLGDGAKRAYRCRECGEWHLTRKGAA